MEMEDYLDFAVEIARCAGEEMLKNFNDKQTISYKSDRTVVTNIDKRINLFLIEKVREFFPDHSVIGEENSLLTNSSYVWVCDPIDGTGMFTDGVPVSVFSLALVVNGEVKVAVVYDPYIDNMYTAIKGEGAYLDGERIHVNDKKLGDLGYKLNFEMWENAKFDTISMAKSMLDSCTISSIGSVARSAVAIASGNFSCDLFPGTDHGNCDIAAASLIVEEAGGMVTDMYGNPQRYDGKINGAIISNGISHEAVYDRIKDFL